MHFLLEENNRINENYKLRVVVRHENANVTCACTITCYRVTLW